MIPRSNTGRLGKAGRWCRTRRYSEQAGQARGSDLRPVLRLVRRFRLGEGGRLARRRLRTGGDLHQAAQLCLERVQIPSGKLRAAGELDRARIDGASVAVKLVMQVRAGRHAGRSDIADDLALLDPLPCRHLDTAHLRSEEPTSELQSL